MPALMLDPHYCDSYSECSSSNSSFSIGALTPATSTQFSAAPSRRQSIASEGQSCPESSFEKVPNYSSDGMMTPLRTPPPFRQEFRPVTYLSGTQGYDADYSPMFPHQPRRLEGSSMSSGPQLQAAFAPQGIRFDTSQISGFVGDIYDESQQNEAIKRGLRPTEKGEVDWSAPFNQDVFPTHYHSESVQQTITTFDFDMMGKLHASDLQDGQTSSGFADFGGFDVLAVNLPQTVAPQQTIYPNTSYIPTDSTYPLLSPSRTPELKSESDICSSPAVSPLTPLSPSPRQKDLNKDQDLPLSIRTTTRRSCRSTRKNKRETPSRRSTGPPFNVGNITVHASVDIPSSANKKHKCEECDINFDRPEHHKRHKGAEAHIQRCRDLGLPVEEKDPKPYKCKVPECAIFVKGITRRDNLKPHYQKTHFFEKADGGSAEKHRKRNIYVSPEYARDVLGLGEWDLRTEWGNECLRKGLPPRLDPCKFDDASD
ncbi:MAG: hypothetical protein Q9168_006882 [Polycauliona sp. 1 TL-2023]